MLKHKLLEIGGIWSNCLLMIVLIIFPLLSFWHTFEIVYVSFLVLLPPLMMRSMKGTIHVNYIDIALFFYLVYFLLNVCYVSRAVDAFCVYKKLLFWGFYWLARQSTATNLKWILVSVVLSGIVEIFILTVQYFEFNHTHDSKFFITGSFDNPGIFGCYLSIPYIVLLYLLLFWKSADNIILMRRILFGIGCSVLLVLIIISESRSSIAAVAFASVYLYLYKVNGSRFKKSVWMVILIICGICFMYLLYQYREGSANVRLLIWRVSFELFKDSPIWGHGISSFAGMYMNYQMEFISHAASPLLDAIADDNINPFNEYILIACEQGIIAAIIMLPITTYDITYNAGYAYLKINQMEKAKAAMKRAHGMIPSRILPLYALFLIGKEQGDLKETRRMANQIVKMKPKIKGSIYFKAKREATSYLQSDK